MDKKKLKQYVDVKFRIAELEEQANTLKADIVADMSSDKIEKMETDFGTFTRANRTNWKYTDKVKTLEEKVKVAKVKEQQSGKAKSEVTEYLVYTAPKLD